MQIALGNILMIAGERTVAQHKEETKAEIKVSEYQQPLHSVEYYEEANDILDNIRYRKDGIDWISLCDGLESKTIRIK